MSTVVAVPAKVLNIIILILRARETFVTVLVVRACENVLVNHGSCS